MCAIVTLPLADALAEDSSASVTVMHDRHAQRSVVPCRRSLLHDSPVQCLIDGLLEDVLHKGPVCIHELVGPLNPVGTVALHAARHKQCKQTYDMHTLGVAHYVQHDNGDTILGVNLSHAHV